MSTLRARIGAVDPLIALLGLTGIVVYALHGFGAPLDRDLGIYTYGGQRLLAGDPPYVGVLNRAGPLAHALPGVGIGMGRLVGVSDIVAARGLFMLIAVACVCLVYVVVRDLTRSRAAALVAAVALLGFQGFTDSATQGPREKTAMVLFLLAAVLCVRHRRWATTGVLVALGTLTWQPVFFVAVVVATVAALLAPDRRLIALARIAAGGAATTAVVVAYYVVNGALHTFLEGFVLINAQYTVQPGVADRPDEVWASLREGYGPSLWVIALGLAAVLGLAAMSAGAAWRTHEPVPTTWVGLGAGTLAGFAWSAVAFNAWPDLFVLLPFAAIGVGGLAAEGLRRLEPGMAVAATLTLVLVGTTYAVVHSVTTRPHGLQTQRASVAAVLRHGPRPATILSIQAPQALVMSRHRNPSSYQMFDHGFPEYVDDTFPGGLTGFVTRIQDQEPDYIVVQTGFHPRWLMPWLRQHYATIGVAPSFQWWARRSLGPAVLRRLHDANREAVRHG